MSNFVSLADLRRLGLGQISVASGGGGGGGGLAVQARQATAYTAPGASRPISFTPIVKTATPMAPVQVAQPSSAISIAPIQKTANPTQVVNANAISISRPGVENAAEATNRIRTGGFSIATGIPNLPPVSNSAQTAAQNTYFTPPTVVRESTPLPTAAGVPMISTAYSSTPPTGSTPPAGSTPPIASRPPTSTPPTETPPPRGGGGPQTSTPFEPISLTTPSPSYTPQFPSNVDYPTPQPQAFPPQQLQFPQQVESGGGYFGSYWISDDEYHGANVKDSDGVNVVSKVKPGSLKQKGDSFSAGLKASFSTTRGKVAAGAIAVGLTAAVAYFGKDYLGLKF